MGKTKESLLIKEITVLDSMAKVEKENFLIMVPNYKLSKN
jgi:hypothetical protein